MKKKMPLYSGGNNPTVTPSLSPQRAVLPLERAVLPLIKRYYRFPRAVMPRKRGWDPERYYRGGRAVLPPLLPLLVPQNPTREKALSSRGGSKTEQQRYCRRVQQAVLPLSGAVLPLEALRRYYR